MAAAAATCVVGLGVAWAAPGDLDPAFSGDGRAVVNLGGEEFAANTGAVAVQPDGAVVVVGQTDATTTGRPGFAVARVRADGSPDTTFSGDGLAAFDIGPTATARAVALQPDGKIVVAGDGGSTPVLTLVRLNPDGSLDSSFNGGGVVGIDGGGSSRATGVAVQADGKIVTAGYNIFTGRAAFVVARTNADGTPDSSFDGDGLQTVAMGNIGEASAVALQPDGKIVVAGTILDIGVMAAARLNTDGSLDATFGNGGRVTVSFGGVDGANALALQGDGKIVLAGSTTNGAGVGSLDYAIARLEPNGATDLTFSDDGKQTASFGGDDVARGVAVQSNGRIVVAGEGDANRDLVLTRLNTDGSFDPTFGTHSTVGIDFGGLEYGGQLALQPDGGIVIGGATTAGTRDLVVARVLGDPVSASGAGTGTGGTGGAGAGGTVGNPGTGSPTGSAGAAATAAASKLRLSPNSFAARSSGPSATRTGKRGARLSFTLSLSARVIFTVQKAVAGRRVKHQGKTLCDRLTGGNRAKPRCSHLTTLAGSFSLAGLAGANTFTFSGRLNGHKLAPGRYLLVATPTVGNAHGAPVTTPFTIAA